MLLGVFMLSHAYLVCCLGFSDAGCRLPTPVRSFVLVGVLLFVILTFAEPIKTVSLSSTLCVSLLGSPSSSGSRSVSGTLTLEIQVRVPALTEQQATMNPETQELFATVAQQEALVQHHEAVLAQ